MRKFYIKLPTANNPFYLSEVNSTNVYYNNAEFTVANKWKVLFFIILIPTLIYCFSPGTYTVHKAFRVGALLGLNLRHVKNSAVKDYFANNREILLVPSEISDYVGFKFSLYIIFNSIVCIIGVSFGIYVIFFLNVVELNLQGYLSCTLYTAILFLLDSRSKRYKFAIIPAL